MFQHVQKHLISNNYYGIIFPLLIASFVIGTSLLLIITILKTIFIEQSLHLNSNNSQYKTIIIYRYVIFPVLILICGIILNEFWFKDDGDDSYSSNVDNDNENYINNEEEEYFEI